MEDLQFGKWEHWNSARFAECVVWSDGGLAVRFSLERSAEGFWNKNNNIFPTLQKEYKGNDNIENSRRKGKPALMERKNVNRGFKKLRVWNDAVDLYVFSCSVLLNFPFELKKTAGNCIDSAHSISRNIAEGYCRKSIKEYLNFLNIALASSGEFHSSLTTFLKANQISNEDFEKLDELHFKTENALINLIKSLQVKLRDGTWEDSFR